jgi:hypothetical protein
MLHGLPLGVVSAQTAAYLAEQSLLFDGASYLSRDPASAGNAKIGGIDVWVKLATLGTTRVIAEANQDANNRSNLFFSTANKLAWSTFVGGTGYQWVSDATFTDTSGFLHISAVHDTTASSGNRLTVTANGVELSGTWGTEIPLNTDTEWNTTSTHYIGGQASASGYFTGVMALVRIIDGAAVAITDLLTFNDDNTIQPKEYTGSYGTNGGLYDFADTSDFGKDTNTTATATASTSGDWAGDTGNTTFSGDDIDHGAATSIYAAEGLTGDFEVQGIQVDNATAFRFGVYDAAEQGTFNSADADGGLKSMTNSALIDGGNNNYYSGSTNDGGTPQSDFANGTTIIIKRVGSTIVALDASDRSIKHTFSASWSGTTNIMFGNTNTNFDDISWKDESSGVIGNDFASSGFASTDLLADVPNDDADLGLGDFARLNPNDASSAAVIDAENTFTVSPSAWHSARSTLYVQSGAVQKIYFEWTDNNADVHNNVGLMGPDSILTNSPGTCTQYAGYFNNENVYDWAGTNTTTWTLGAFSSTDVGMGFYDAETGELWLGKNGTWNGSGNPSTGASPDVSDIPTDGTPVYIGAKGYSSSSVTLNFGDNAFAYTVPTDGVVLATQNLPVDHPLYIAGAAQLRAGVQIHSVTFSSDDSGKSDASFRQTYDASTTADQAFTRVRFLLEAHSSQPSIYDNLSTGIHTSGGSTAATPVNVTVDGSTSVTLAAGSKRWTDWVELTGTSGQVPVLIADLAGSNGYLRRLDGGSNTVYEKASTNSYNVANISGLGFISSTRTYLASKIEVQ